MVRRNGLPRGSLFLRMVLKKGRGKTTAREGKDRIT
jgi:hypothetical protein